MTKTFLHKYFLLVLVLILFSGFLWSQKVPVAQKQKTDPEYTIELYSAFKNAKTFSLSSFAESIEYIALEKTKDCLIGEHLANIFIDEKNIIVFDYDNCFRFNRMGKFINKIGIKGRGPGEHQRPMSIEVDAQTQSIYFMDIKRILKYNFQGEFLNECQLDFSASQILKFKNNIFLLNNMMFQYADPDKRFSIKLFSEKEEKIISNIECPKKDKIPFSIDSPTMYNYNLSSFVKDYWDNTVYRVLDPFSLNPYATINTGKLKHRDKDDKSVFQGQKNQGDELVLSITYMSETDRYIFMITNKGLFIYDKTTNETNCCEYTKVGEKWSNFVNDLTGGPTFLSNNFPKLTVDNNRFITFNHAYEFFEDGIDTHNKQIKEVMKTLQPDDNPVLVLVKLKE